jgi:hypothetical protein
MIQKNVVHGGSQDTLTSFKYGWQTKIYNNGCCRP